MGGLSGSSRPSGRLRLGGLSRLGGLILLTALLLPGGLLLLNAPGHAQTRDAAPAPPTSAEWAVDGLLEPPSMRPLPPLPEGYRAQESGGQRWISHARAAEPVEALREEFAAIWIEVCEELGVELEANVEIRVARNPEEMRQLAPSDAPPPEYAVGVAYPSRGLILLTLTAPSSWERPAMGSVLEHEISHLALYRAVDGHPLPRWFVEGVAIHQAGEYGLDRIRTLWDATRQGRLHDLASLSARFPSRPHEVSVAYAQSADIIAYLLRDHGSAGRFQAMLRALRRGTSFEEALQHAYGRSLSGLEAEWSADVQVRFEAIPLVFGSGTFWALAAILLIAAWLKRRSYHRRGIARLAKEERAIEVALLSVEETIDARLLEPSSPSASPALERPGDGAQADFSGDAGRGRSSDPPLPMRLRRRSDPELPCVEFEGERHTLH